MERIWKSIKAFFERNLIKLLYEAVLVAGKAIDYLQDRRKDKAEAQTEKETQKAERKIDGACDKGGVDDLFEAAEWLKKARKKEEALR